jgi:hypothetical protein
MSGTICWPNGDTTRPIVTSPYGRRPVTIPGASSFHRGVDTVGYSIIHAIADGVVESVGWIKGWEGGGYMVWIRHDGFLSRNLHLVDGSALVGVGQRVAAGQPIAHMGNTGIDGGVHHHLEVVVNGDQVDPIPFITARLAASGYAQTAYNSVEEYMSSKEDGRFIAAFDGNILVVDIFAGTYWNIARGLPTVGLAFERRDWYVKALGVDELVGPQSPNWIAGLNDITNEGTLDKGVLEEIRKTLAAHH